MTNESKIEILRGSDIFSSFSGEELSFVAANSSVCELAAGEMLFRRNDASVTLFCLASGEVTIFKTEDNGGETEIARFMKGNCFGELSFLTGSPRNADARSEKDSVVICFPRTDESFESVLRQHPAVSAKILHHLLVMVAGRIRVSNALIKENSPVMQELKKQVYVDKMTGIYNKTYMEEKLQGMLASKPSSLGYLSIKPDNFKEINDTYGHEAGDEAIRMFARGVRTITGDEEAVSRYMGNEMTILLPGQDRSAVLAYAEALREKVLQMSFSEVTQGNPFAFTVSIGLAVYPDHADNAADLISKARELPLISRAHGGGMILFPDHGLDK